MKTRLFKTLFILSFVGMTITACGQKRETVLEYATEWSSDAVEHWHACTTEGHTDEKGDLAQHTFGEGVVTPATYDADGYTTYTCSICGYSYKDDYTHKLSHTFSTEWSVDDENGTHYHACLDEGYTDLRADESEHDYDLGVVTPATYEAAGFITYTCKVCGHEDVRNGDAKLEHTYADTWSHNETKHWHACLDEGYTTLKADEADHDFEVTVIPATHVTPEYEIHECKICHYIMTTEGGEAINHNFSTEWTSNAVQHWHACTDEGYTSLKKDTADHTFQDVVTPATFEDQGYTTHTCTVCGYSYVDSYTDVRTHSFASTWSHDASTHWHACTDEGYTTLKADEGAHTWNAGEVTTEPTETTTGVKTFTCTVCGGTKTEVIPMTAHHFADVWSSNGTHHWHACTDANCDVKDAYAEHTFDSGEYHEATYDFDAYTLYTCTVCGYQYSQSQNNSRLSLQDEAHLTFKLNEEHSGYVVTGYDGHLFDDFDYDLFIPEAHTENDVTLPVVEIGEEAFLNCIEVEMVVMGDNLAKISRSAFNTCVNLHTVELGKDVKTIQSNAFANCYKMTEVFNQSTLNIKVGSTTYGNIARNAAAVVTNAANRGVIARNPSNVNELVYTRGNVRVLVNYANPGDTQSDVTLNYDEIKPYAFIDDDHVTGVTFGANVTSIGHHAFLNSGLTSVSIPATVTSIGDNAFENCDALVNATLANTEISNYQFKDCDALETVTAPSATKIGMGAFEFSSLESFTIGDQVASIGASAFASTYITSIAIPAATTKIEEGAFYNCSSLKTLTVDAENPNFSSTNNVLYNKAGTTLICYPAGIPANAWSEVTLSAELSAHLFVAPATLTSIESNAFYKAQLEAIAIPSTISSIGSTPFRLAENLKVILMLDAENSYTPGQTVNGMHYSVNNGVLYENSRHWDDDNSVWVLDAYCTTLVSFPAKLPTTLYATHLNTVKIADYAFEGAEGLEFIFLGDADAGACNINIIGVGAFRNCVNLNAVSLIANMGGTRFGLNCFEGCPVRTLNYIGTEASNFKLLNGEIDNLHACGIDTIICMDVASWYTTSLIWNDSTEEYDAGESGNYVFADGITKIQKMSFAASGVRSVVIPKEVTEIGEMAFGNCYNLTSVTFEEGSQLKTIGKQAFGNCTGLKSIVLPEGVETIGEEVFGGCSQLKSITIPSTVTSIDARAFGNCTALTTVNVSGTGNLAIGEQAFGNCAALQAINLSSHSSVTIGNQVFAGCSALSIVILPASYSLGVAAFYGDINLSNASDATMPLFFMDGSDAASTVLTSFNDSATATGQACAVVYMTDMEDPTTVVYTLKLSFSFYSEATPTAEQLGVLDYLAANYPQFTYSYWHLVDGVPTLW